MAPEFPSGTYKIISILDGNAPASVSLAKRPFQSVRLGQEVTDWKIRKEGENTYQLSISGYSDTRVADGTVTVTISSEDKVFWIATYRELQEAYTIQPANDEAKGWTAPESGEENQAIKVETLVVGTSEPPKFLTTQLFKFVSLNV